MVQLMLLVALGSMEIQEPPVVSQRSHFLMDAVVVIGRTYQGVQRPRRNWPWIWDLYYGPDQCFAEPVVIRLIPIRHRAALLGFPAPRQSMYAIVPRLDLFTIFFLTLLCTLLKVLLTIVGSLLLLSLMNRRGHVR